MGKIKRALMSVSDKTGLLNLAKVLDAHGVELIASGGTAKVLEQAGLPFTAVEKISGKGEYFQGRMKTLSFEIASSLLFRREDPADAKTAEELGLQPIDLVVVNLYPFHQTVAKGADLSECIENIDIGGPTLLRAAAKNHQSVTVLNSPVLYEEFVEELSRNQGMTSLAFRQKCARQVFAMTAFYDLAIASYLEQEGGAALRYGENPHQRAVLLKDPFSQGFTHKEPLQGKEMSYNNFLDADFAIKSLQDIVAWQGAYAHPVAVVVKHNTPCGMAVSETPLFALEKAWKGDEKSSFGGIIALSFPVTKEVAEFFHDKFIEVLLAPSFTAEAQSLLKKNCRLMEISLEKRQTWDVRSIDGGALIQQSDSFATEGYRQVTEKKFSPEMAKLAIFSMLCVKNLKSNAIALCREDKGGFEMISFGSGQTNRVDCIEKLLAPRLKDKGIEDLSQMVLASDAFFPFADSIEVAARLGVKYVIQPGGSIKDGEVIAEADKQGIAMIFSGRRHFLH